MKTREGFHRSGSPILDYSRHATVRKLFELQVSVTQG